MSTADGRKNVCPERRRPNRTRTKRLGSDLLRNGSDWRKRSATIALPSKRNNLSPKEKHKTAAIAAGSVLLRYQGRELHEVHHRTSGIRKISMTTAKLFAATVVATLSTLTSVYAQQREALLLQSPAPQVQNFTPVQAVFACHWDCFGLKMEIPCPSGTHCSCTCINR